MLIFTLPETNSSPLKIDHPKRKGSSYNHPFSGATVDGRNPAPVDVVDFPVSKGVLYIPGGAGGFLKHQEYVTDSWKYSHPP